MMQLPKEVLLRCEMEYKVSRVSCMQTASEVEAIESIGTLITWLPVVVAFPDKE